MKKETISKFILTAIGLVGGVLVSEQIISGEELASIQGIAGMVLVGSPIGLGLVIGAINLIPKSTAKNIVDKIGADKVADGFAKVDSVVNEVVELKDTVNRLLEQLEIERQAKIELGVYDTVSQELKDKLL